MNLRTGVWTGMGIAVLLTGTVPAAESVRTWTMVNPTVRQYSNELVRLKIDVPADISPAKYAVTEDGKKVPWQVEEIAGKKAIWVCTDLAQGQTHTYALETGPSGKWESVLGVTKQSGIWNVESPVLGVQVPAETGTGIPAPVLQVRLPDGKWVGKGTWNTQRKLKSFTSEVVGSGPIFVKIRLKYEFDGNGGVLGEEASCYRADISLEPGKRHVVIEESYAMGREDSWEFDAAAGWAPRQALTIPHFGGFDRPEIMDPDGKPYPFPPQSLKFGQTRMGDTLLNLVPRWSQAYDDGWFFMAHDGANAVGTLVYRAGKWLWPYDGMIEVKVKPSADFAGFRCPTWRGKRYWFLTAGPRETWADKPACEEYVIRYSFETLDKIHQEYLIDWPGLQYGQGPGGDPALTPTNFASGAGRFGRRSKPFFGWGPGSGSIAGDAHPIVSLIRAQTLLDPDTFGNYWLFYSSENPNFATSWWSPAYGEVAKCKGHPQFEGLVKLAEMKLREDIYHSVTYPGGAGQECPGYMAGAVDHLRRNARFCKENLGFDLTNDTRLKSAGAFILHLSHPIGDGSRRSHPGGDTHPPGPAVFQYAENFGMLEDPATFVTEELPGFGVVFRNQPATPRETYLAFKSGPNRGHFHGDQLSFHYCAYGRVQLADHHCSYNPRAGQEHMHNRVAFHTEKLPWANMDGYERVIAFKPSPEVDLAMGEVESERLRVTEKSPPEKWDTRFPQEIFDTPLKYRRTIVSLKSKARDIFVIRDQHAGPDVFATYCLHAYGEKCEQQDKTFHFDGVSVFVAAPKEFQVSRHDWQHSNGGLESTKGLRLTTRGRTSEFITVLVPRPVQTVETVELVLKDGLIRVEEFKGGKLYESKQDVSVGFRSQNGKVLGEPPRISVTDPRGVGCLGTPTVTETAEGLKIELQAEFAQSRSVKASKGVYVIELKKDGIKYSGTFKGTCTPVEKNGPGKAQDVAGAVTGEFKASGFPFKAEYRDEPLPVMVAVPGGVKVGDDEVIFAGGIDDQDAVSYVTVRRGGRDVATLTGRDVDLDRSQGEIGLFVPDAGYPFGVIPDWLIRQRCKRPDWYQDLWPLTRQTKP